MAVVEQYANDVPNDSVATTLNGAINNSVTSITVTSFTGFPTSAQYRIRIDNEIMIVTGGAGTTTWTVTRGAEGTPAASHLDLATVIHNLTRDGLIALGTVIHRYETFASRPAAGTAGRLFLPQDGISAEFDNGTTWSPFGPLWRWTPPVDGDYAWVNQGTASITATADGLFLLTPAESTGANLRLRVKSYSAPKKLTVFFLPMLFKKSFQSMGIAFRESGTGKLVVLDLLCITASDLSVRAAKFTSATVFSADYQLTGIPILPQWLQIEDDNTNLKFRFSGDGRNWIDFFSIGRTDFLAGGPNQWGYYVNGENNVTPNLKAGATLCHWLEE
jgi:hypothetical protein